MTKDERIAELEERLKKEIYDKVFYYLDLQGAQKRIAELEREVADCKDGTIIVRYEQQLAEKDELIKKYARDAVQYRREIQDARHEICEKIREKFLEKCKNSFCSNPASVDYITLEISEIEEFIDKIERGEE